MYLYVNKIIKDIIFYITEIINLLHLLLGHDMQDLLKLAGATEHLVYFHTLGKASPMRSQFLPKKLDHGFDSEDKKGR